MDNNSFYQHTGVYGICVADKHILVIRKIIGPYTGKYDLPGGRLEKLESLEQGVTREVREETGYLVQRLKSIGVCDFTVIWSLQENLVENLHHIAILYEIAIDLNKPPDTIESFEGQDSGAAIWLPIDEVSSKNSSPLVLQSIEWIQTGSISTTRSSFDYRV